MTGEGKREKNNAPDNKAGGGGSSGPYKPIKRRGAIAREEVEVDVYRAKESGVFDNGAYFLAG